MHRTLNFLRLVAVAAVAAIALAAGAEVAPNAIPNLKFGKGDGRFAAVQALPDGSILVAGNFGDVNGISREGIALVNPDGSVNSAWDAGLSGEVDALLVVGATVYVGGWFTHDLLGPSPRRNLARLSLADGHVDPTWAADVDGSIAALASDGTYLYVGGNFTACAGVPRSSLARIALADGQVNAWTNDVTNSGSAGYVQRIALDSTNLYVGGMFDTIGGAARSGIARVSTSSSNSPDAGWIVPGSFSGVTAIAVNSTDVYVAGSMSSSPRVVRVSKTSGTVDPAWAPQPSGEVRAMFVDSTGALVAARFAANDGSGVVYRDGLAEVDLLTGALTSWNPCTAHPLGCIGNVIVEDALGAVLATTDNGALERMARDSGQIDGSFKAFGGGGGAPEIRAIVLSGDGRTYVGGDFRGVEGRPIAGVARINVDGSVDNAWHPDPDRDVWDIALSGSDLIVGGAFGSIGGLPRSRIAKVGTGSTAQVDATWNPGADATVTNVLVDGPNVFAAGWFSNIGRQARAGLAKIPVAGSGATDTSWNAGLASIADVGGLASDGTGLFVAGVLFDGVAMVRLAKFSTSTGARVTSWNPAPSDAVRAIRLAGPSLIVAGDFTRIAGVNQPHLAKLNAADATLDATWNPQVRSTIDAIAIDGGVVYAAPVQGINGLDKNSAAVSVATGRPDFSWSTGLAQFSTLQAAGGTVWAGISGTWLGRSAVASFAGASCAGQANGTACDGGPGITNATCQASICTPPFATPSISLQPSPARATYGGSVTLTATISGDQSTTTEEVDFFDQDGNAIGYAVVSGGTATTQVFNVNHDLLVEAIFRGNVGNAPARSATVAITVQPSGFDFDGDHHSDLVWRNTSDGSLTQWLMNGLYPYQQSSLGGPGTTDQPKHIADFNGDGKSDILWEDTDGTTSMTLFDGANIISDTVLVGGGTGWSVTHVGDFNGDGKSDLVWTHTNGAVQMWLMDGPNATSVAGFVPAGTGWSVLKIADLNGDGKSDILWQHTDGTVVAWLMDGTSVTAAASFAGAGSGWTVALAADLDGDGKDDLVWTHSSGAVQAWLMNGSNVTQVASFVGSGAGWTPTHAGDLDGDGRADLLWRHTDGTVLAWLMGPNLSVSQVATFAGSGNTWSITHLRDLSADGRNDILWRAPDGSVQAWIMNGLTPASIAQLAGPGPYQIVPPMP